MKKKTPFPLSQKQISVSRIARNQTHATLNKQHEVSPRVLVQLQCRLWLRIHEVSSKLYSARRPKQWANPNLRNNSDTNANPNGRSDKNPAERSLNFPGFGTQWLKLSSWLWGSWPQLISYPHFNIWFISFIISFMDSFITGTYALTNDQFPPDVLNFSGFSMQLPKLHSVYFVTNKYFRLRLNGTLRCVYSKFSVHLNL